MHKYRKVYVMENQIGNVKIGVSGNVEGRRKAIQNQTGYKINRVYETKDCYNPFDIERELHKKYIQKKIFGEWFEVCFDEVVKDLEILFEEMAKLEDTSESNWSVEDMFRYFHPEVYEKEEK